MDSKELPCSSKEFETIMICQSDILKGQDFKQNKTKTPKGDAMAD